MRYALSMICFHHNLLAKSGFREPSLHDSEYLKRYRLKLMSNNILLFAKFALSLKNCSQKGYALSHGSRKKRRVGPHVTVPSGNLLELLPPPITSPLSVCVERCVNCKGKESNILFREKRVQRAKVT